MSATPSCLSETKHRSIYWHSKLSTSSVFTVKTYMSFQVNFQFSVPGLFKLLIGISILVWTALFISGTGSVGEDYCFPT